MHRTNVKKFILIILNKPDSIQIFQLNFALTRVIKLRLFSRIKHHIRLIHRNKLQLIPGYFMQKILLLLTQDIDKTDVVHIVSDTVHNAPNTCRSQLKMIVFLISFVIKIHKLIRKPGARIQRNTDPFCHTMRRHIFQNADLVCDSACILINFLSLHCEAYSSRKPLKKLHSKSILQRLDNLAHTRLRRIKNLRCITERTRLCTYYKIL